ncbi:MAG: aconitate hydratase [bacterium]
MSKSPPRNVTRKLIESHLVDGRPEPGAEIALRIDQTLTQDATGTLVMLEFEALGIDRVRTEISAQYVDHNLVQQDHRNADDHLFLRSACRRFGLWYAPPGTGVSHPVHQDAFGRPQRTLLGSDSHTCAAGALGMLAIGAGGLDVALAMGGEPFRFSMPEVRGVRLVGELPDRVSAKDVVLEMLRRHGVSGGLGQVFEYHGPGLERLSVLDRHVIANMGTELGATTTVFPSDAEVRRFLRTRGREDEWTELVADPGAHYDREEEIDLSALEPLIAMPSSPGNVVPVTEVAGQEIYQAYLGSSANPGHRDFAVAAEIVKGKRIPDSVSFDVNPVSRRLLRRLIADGRLGELLAAGARIHQAGCNGCIGMGQAPATGRLSLRTVPRNFPGRSGTREDRVCLVSPETAAASALAGRITDPRTLEPGHSRFAEPDEASPGRSGLVAPLPPREAAEVELEKGPNIVSLPELEELPDELELPVLVRAPDDVSTDEILPAGTRALPDRSNLPAISRFTFRGVDESYVERARELDGGHAVVGGRNYGQGSSREHAALAPRYLGLRVVLARSFARIHRRNLINFGVLPLILDAEDAERIEPGDTLRLRGIHEAIDHGDVVPVVVGKGDADSEIEAKHDLSTRERRIVRDGGLINHARRELVPGSGDRH